MILAIIIGIFYLLVGRPLGEACRDEGNPVELAKSLSEKELVDLYSKMESLLVKGYKTIDAPKEISGLKIKHADRSSGVLVIGGCFDNKTMLGFKGLKGTVNAHERRSIILSWNEYPVKTLVLWEER